MLHSFLKIVNSIVWCTMCWLHDKSRNAMLSRALLHWISVMILCLMQIRRDKENYKVHNWMYWSCMKKKKQWQEHLRPLQSLPPYVECTITTWFASLRSSSSSHTSDAQELSFSCVRCLHKERRRCDQLLNRLWLWKQCILWSKRFSWKSAPRLSPFDQLRSKKIVGKDTATLHIFLQELWRPESKDAWSSGTVWQERCRANWFQQTSVYH